ncbi:MAG: malto-oligosyltrehalose trehalohydrolase [Cyanobacteria bacterium P01_D01_bin.1]
MDIGARFKDGCRFTVWAPLVDSVAVEVVGHEFQPVIARTLEMERDDLGYWRAHVPDLPAGTLYKYRLNGEDAWPDPASRYQPEGVHGPSEVIDHSQFAWSDQDWKGVPLENYVIYELHVGTFTATGTFEAAIDRLDDLVDLGVTAVEIMPVAQFPGDRNWGYDGVFPFAVQNSYGGPTALKKLVNACHQKGLAIILDVVYNHFGPEGNYTGKFGPYTTARYQTPWGSAINFDDAYSDGVREYFTENAVSWLCDYHFDALRLDAVHAIYDFGAKHFLQSLSESVAEFTEQRSYPGFLIAESDLNDPRLIRPVSKGGYQLSAQWSDDFHHALHTRLTGESAGYYGDFANLKSLAIAIKDRFVYAGQYSPFRHRPHGSPADDLPSYQFVVCNQNHDQVGNRMMGDRLSTLVSFSALKLAAGVTLLSPYIPLLFMGEEYGETNPFLYFVDHGDPDLIEAVRRGRTQEFSDFYAQGTPPDPVSEETFNRSTLNWLSDTDKSATDRQQQRIMRRFYQRLIEVRHQCKIMTPTTAEDVVVTHTNNTLQYKQSIASGDLFCAMNFSNQAAKIDLTLGSQTWWQQLNSADARWCPEGSEASKKSEPLPARLSAEESDQTLLLSPFSIALYRAEPVSAWSLSQTAP